MAYVSAEVAAREPDAAYFEGPPVLAVEILSPSDTQEDIDEKVELYLETGVAIVWVVNPGSGPSPSTAPAPTRSCSRRHARSFTAEPHLPPQCPIARARQVNGREGACRAHPSRP